MDDGIVMSLDTCNWDPVVMWKKLATDYNKVTDSQRASARKAFLNFKIQKEENYLQIQNRYNDLIRQVLVQGGTLTDENRRDTLLGALPRKYDTLKEAYFAQGAIGALPIVDYIWDRMFDIETTEKRRAEERGYTALIGEGYYQSTRGRGFFRGRARDARGGLGGGRRATTSTEGSENCFRCGEADHWSR